MELAKLQQQILSSNKTASEKAEDLLLKREVNEMSKDEWRELIAGIPEDVEREIGRLKSAGTQLTNCCMPCKLVVHTGLGMRAPDTVLQTAVTSLHERNTALVLKLMISVCSGLICAFGKLFYLFYRTIKRFRGATSSAGHL